MRRTNFYKGWITVLLLVYGGLLNSCHQDPVIPTSLIPFTCQIGFVESYDGPVRSTIIYQYDAFGNQVAIKDSGSNVGTRVLLYTFDADQYLVSQQVNGTKYTFTYTGTPKLISRIAGGDYAYDYSYEGDQLKAYTKKNNSAGTTDTYTFSGGVLTGVTLSNGSQIEVSGGKIKTFTSGGVVTNYTYDTQGQTTQIESVTSAAGSRIVTQYTYDTKKFYYNASLRARGFPVLAKEIQPGYDGAPGYGTQVNNYQTITITSFKKDAAGVETTVSTETQNYRHQYNAEGYSTGYLRSDGARAKYYYTNCQ